MKVGLVNWSFFPAYLGGAERHTSLLATHLSRQGATVDLVTGLGTQEDLGVSRVRVINLGWHGDLPDFVANMIFARRAAQVLWDSDYDVIYGQNLGLAFYVRRKLRPCVVNPHGIDWFKSRNSVARIRCRPRHISMKHAARRADVVISLGGRLTGEIHRHLGVPEEKTFIIPNGVDLAVIDEAQHAGPGSDESIPHSLLFVGRLTAQKGVHQLLAACERLEARTGWRLFIVGDGPLRKDVEKFADDNRNHVTFLGQIAECELHRWYRRLETLVVPTLGEGMPTVILEAMGHCRPAIASDVGAVATMVNPETGWLVQAGNVAALRDAMEACLSLSESDRSRMGLAARRLVEQRFTWPIVARQTLSLLQSMSRER